MKILIFSPYYPPHIGGLETHSDEFNKYLSQQGIDITVFTPRLPIDATEKEVCYNNVQIIRFPAFEIIHNYPLPKFWTRKFWHLFLSLFSTKYDFIISRTRFFFSSFMALLYTKITRTKLVHIEHGSDFVQLSSSFKTALAKLYDYTFGFLVFRFSYINISISKAVNNFVQQFDKRESPVIYRGIDFDQIDAIAPDAEIRKQFPDKIIIVTAARLYKWKGIENSIQIIKTLPENIKSKIIFIIIGDGEDFNHLKKISDDSICMFGKLSRKKTLSILKASDIYIHSSFPGGGLSTSLLEAMYCQCAIIATPNEGANEIIKDENNGLLVDILNKELSIQKIISLVNNVERRRILGKQASYDIRQQFNWKNTIQQYLNILHSL